ncbi:MAG: M28 family peptidase [Candidatus Lokiarchaeota archaeon]|nr:M28 family peptidase [Candidatus Lokiarchaeota archaeon]
MIDESRIEETVKAISFPRLSGTADERKILTLMSKKLSMLNLDLHIQDFEFSTFFGRSYPKIGFLFGFVLIVFFYLNFESILIPVLSLIILITLISTFLITRNPENIRLKRILSSANIYVKILPSEEKQEEQDTNNLNIFFFSHLDSKGQRFSILARIRAIRVWAFTSLILVVIIILKNYLFIQLALLFYGIGLIPFILNLIATILILFNTSNNLSDGAIDDASGISCVFELLNHYLEPESRLKNFNLFFIFTGAEECGTMGIRNFYKLIKDLSKESIFFFNFDSIAESIYLFPGKNHSNRVKTLYKMFLSNKMGLEIKSNPKKIYFGSHSDGYYMKRMGFDGIGIGDMDCYKYIHSINDTPDRVNYSLLKKLCEVIIDVLDSYDKQF